MLLLVQYFSWRGSSSSLSLLSNPWLDALCHVLYEGSLRDEIGVGVELLVAAVGSNMIYNPWSWGFDFGYVVSIDFLSVSDFFLLQFISSLLVLPYPCLKTRVRILANGAARRGRRIRYVRTKTERRSLKCPLLLFVITFHALISANTEGEKTNLSVLLPPLLPV